MIIPPDATIGDLTALFDMIVEVRDSSGEAVNTAVVHGFSVDVLSPEIHLKVEYPSGEVGHLPVSQVGNVIDVAPHLRGKVDRHLVDLVRQQFPVTKIKEISNAS